MILETLLDTSNGFGPSCVCRPRNTVKPGVGLEFDRRRSVKHLPHQVDNIFYITARVGLWCLPGKAMCCSQNPLIVDEWSTTSMHTAPIKADLPWPSASWCILSPHYPCVETCFATHWKWTRQRKHILDKQLVMEKNGNIFNITWLVKLCWKTGYHPVVRHTLKNKNQVQLLMASVVQKVHMQYKTLFQKRRQTLVKMNY